MITIIIGIYLGVILLYITIRCIWYFSIKRQLDKLNKDLDMALKEASKNKGDTFNPTNH